MIGLPLLSGFVGEFLILSNTFTDLSKGWAIAAAVGVILGAAYMLSLVQRFFYGPESKLTLSQPPHDLRFSQIAVLAPLAVLMLVLGIAPELWLPMIEKGVTPVQWKQTSSYPQLRLQPVPTDVHYHMLPVQPISTPGEAQR